jgi:serine phosphatase RsbU (regulator of sigma subunit)
VGPIEWAAVRRPLPGEPVCGDQPVALRVGDAGALFGVVDGLGHGAPAAEAAECAARVVSRDCAEPLDILIRSCHRALTDTRGAAMTLARINFDVGELAWIGIGNVTAHVVAKSAKGMEIRSAARLTGGIVGYRLPEKLLAERVPIGPGDLLVIASDGIAEDHLEDIDFAASATTIAEHVLAHHSRETDDALIMAARHRGLAP